MVESPPVFQVECSLQMPDAIRLNRMHKDPVEAGPLRCMFTLGIRRRL